MSAIPSTARHLRPNDLYPVRDDVVLINGSLSLMCGRMLDKVRVAYRLTGEPGLPVLLVLGGISAGRYAWCDDHESSSGWWQDQIGPGQAVDTECYRVLALDYLGGNGGTTSPANWDGAAEQFPTINTADQADVIAHLLDVLGIGRVESVIGASYGGMVAQQLAARHPHRLNKALVVCAGHEATALATGWRHVQRQVLELGLASGRSEEAISIARSLAMCTYRSEREFSSRFRRKPGGGHAAADYLDHCGRRFAEVFDIHAYLCLSQSIDDHYLVPEDVSVHLDLAGFSSDQLVTVQQLISLRHRLGGTGCLTLADSIYGHDAFLKEVSAVSDIIREHLESKQ
jgi:homoserine O-acetyltransferase